MNTIAKGFMGEIGHIAFQGNKSNYFDVKLPITEPKTNNTYHTFLYICLSIVYLGTYFSIKNNAT